MADTKISGLTALTGSAVDVSADTVPIVDDSATTTKKISVQELFKSTFNALFDISGASGGQIKFPATQNASSDANTLDDYEEGTWTPVLTFATPGDLSVTYSTQSGGYTKVGRQVTLWFGITTSAFTFTTASGNLRITGNPFTVNASDAGRGAVQFSGITKAGYTQIVAAAATSSAIVELRASGSGVASAAVTAADTPTGGTVSLTGVVSFYV